MIVGLDGGQEELHQLTVRGHGRRQPCHTQAREASVYEDTQTLPSRAEASAIIRMSAPSLIDPARRLWRGRGGAHTLYDIERNLIDR
jgi:hypothetical protein